MERPFRARLRCGAKMGIFQNDGAIFYFGGGNGFVGEFRAADAIGGGLCEAQITCLILSNLSAFETAGVDHSLAFNNSRGGGLVELIRSLALMTLYCCQ